MRNGAGEWEFKLKLSEQAIKISNPGILQVRRFTRNGEFVGDMMYSEAAPPTGARVLVDPNNPTRRKLIPADATAEELLVPVFRAGRLIYHALALADTRAYAAAQLARLHSGTKRLLNPHEYPVGLEPALADLKAGLILKNRPLAA